VQIITHAGEQTLMQIPSRQIPPRAPKIEQAMVRRDALGSKTVSVRCGDEGSSNL